MKRTTAEVMGLVTNGRERGTLTQKQTAWVLGVWSHDDEQPQEMKTPGGWRGMLFIIGTNGDYWKVNWNHYNRTMTFHLNFQPSASIPATA